ncbi:MAG: LysR family transcriptional regulator [Victivallaceae bacterium]|nr:LysR substrate-binding domain-containing protein [Victivallaceae bacterium]
MEISLLRGFIEVARELHFARAAANLGVTQPSLSRNIQKLENELGVSLFSRSNRWRVSLTAAGRTFLPEAERLLRQLASAEALARAAGKGERGRLSIGAISSMLGNPAFIDSLGEIEKRFPGVTVEIIDSTSTGLTRQIRERTLDLALMRLSDELFSDDELLCEKLYDDTLTVVLPRHHRLAGLDDFPVSALAGERFIMVPERTSAVFRNYLFRFCAVRGGFTPKVSKEINNSYTALRLAAAGLGVTIVSSSYSGMFSNRLCYRNFKDFQPRLPVYSVRSADNDIPALMNFLNLLKVRLNRPSMSKPV